ncbi:Ig-like domain-containing protein [Brevibacillus sedimenti]|uniref:Ig-like domain-containing protein n=1 Tax=Brevibacillus sedimenti TaxID=2613334 RepID=UPI001E45B536|nr:Ig-like domain-containing protein [Anoxybacillus sediminis]UFJ61984.1 hypothetical protein IRT44_03915 [Anoxybacillus sediminis]
MNKKLVLSVLSTAVVASMAASAMAKPDAGFYVGGQVDKYYNIDAFFNHFDEALDEIVDNLDSTTYVDADGNAASFQDILTANGDLSKVMEPARLDHFEKNPYAIVDGTGSYNPEEDEDLLPPVDGGELKVESVTAITKTELKVTFNHAIDAAAAENFKIPGLNVESASLDETKKVVTLKVSGAEAHKTYELTATGLKVNGTTIADIKKTFEMPDATELFKLSVKAADPVLKADGASKTLVTFEVKDAAGNPITAGDIEVAFSTTYGSFAEKRVTVQNGVATVLLTSEFLTSDVNANIIAQIVEAADKDLIGLKAETTVVFSPNPDDVVIGEKPVIASAGASQADRVVVYFNKDIDLKYFIDEKGKLKDDIKFEVYGNVPNSGDVSALTPLKVAGVLPVAGNSKGLTLVLDKSEFLTDNANVFVKFVDSTNGVSQESKASLFKLTDARQPAMLSVQVQDLRTLKVTFSEALDENSVKTYGNWSIDGVKLNNTDYEISVGDFIPNAQGGEDTRHVVTIKKKTGYFGAGTHSLQAAKIGDWAAKSDSNNIANTQTLDFNIPVDETVPTATVEVQSPEQWLVDFNVAVDEDAASAANTFELQVYNEDSKEWDTITDPALKVTKVDDDKFLIETKKDWTKVHNTSTSGKNYFNFKYRLHVAASSFTNAGNGKQNAELNLLLEGKMLKPDVVSPEIKDIVEVTAGTEFKAIMSEPVKLIDSDEDETLAENQSALPEPKAEFIAADNSETIPATVVGYADAYDQEIIITPAKQLKAGEWTLVLRSISDDIGNTAASLTKTFTVAGEPDQAEEFKVLWAFADVDADLVVEDVDSDGDGDNENDYIFLTFSAPFSTTGDFKNVLKTANYTLDGKDLPVGSQVVANIEGYNGTNAITIILPDGTLKGKNAPHVLNISKYLESAKGTKISGALQLKLAYNIDNGSLIPNNAPEAKTGLDQTVVVGAPAIVLAAGDLATDADGDTLTLANPESDDTAVATVALNGNGELEITPVSAGTANISVEVTDGTDTITVTFAVTVNAANNAPTVANPIADQTATVGGGDVTVDASSTFADADGDTLTLTADSDDANVATVTVNGTDIVITPVSAGTTTITVTADDGKGGTVSTTFDVTVS